MIDNATSGKERKIIRMRRSATLLVLLLLSSSVFAVEPLERAPRHERTQHFILKADHLTDADRADLAAKGVELQQALTSGRVVARVSDPSRIAGDTRFSLEPFTVTDKIQRSALREAARAKSYAQLNVLFHRDATFDEARQAIAAAGGTLLDPLETKFGPMQTVEAFIPTAGVRVLATDDRVLTLAGPVRFHMKSDNARAAEQAHVTELYSPPYGLDGSGVVVSLYELAEAQGTHPEFQGRLIVHATGGSTGDQTHATHVSGTIGAAGINPDAKGMAPKATIHQYRASGSAAAWLKSKADNLAPLNVVADNNSWGYILGWQDEGGNGYPVWNGFGEYYGGYDLTLAAPIDQITREKGVLFVHSAGNDGNLPSFDDWVQHRHVNDDLDPILDQVYCISRSRTGTDCPAPPTCSAGPQFCETSMHAGLTPFDTIGVTASAKNSITVGATEATDQILGFSSRGPAKDGRVKPDIVARGFFLLSTVPTNSYARLSGTSMSSPGVTGTTAVITQQWYKTFNGAQPGPMMLKALLIAGARDIGNPGPDYTYGFGFLNGKGSVDLIIADGAKGNRIRTGSLAEGQSYEMPLRVTSTQNVRVVLQWLDPEIAYLGGDDLAAVALVNDLDLKIIDPAGNTVLPYVLDKVNYTANATRGVNKVDNTEEVEIANATPGIYRVVATATKINDRSPQPFVLVANVDATPPCTDFTEPNESAAAAYGDIATASPLFAALCSATDVDFFRFSATKSGDVSVTVTATGDTALRVTLTRVGGTSQTVDVPVGASRTVTIAGTNASANAPAAFTVKIESTGTPGVGGTYTLTPSYGTTTPPRRRTVRQ
jgi:hypothetical protein